MIRIVRNLVKRSWEYIVYTPMNSLRYISHRIRMLSCRALGFFCNSRAVKSKGLIAAVRKA